MPVLGHFPVVDSPRDLTNPFDDSRTFAFRSLDGETLLPFTGDELIARWGIQGLDVPPRENVEEEIPGQDGTDLVDIKVGSRSYFLPIFCGSDSGHLPYLRQRGYFRQFFNHRTVDYKANGGTFDLVANSVMGERTLRSTYVSGMNGDWDQDTAGTYWESFGLNLLSVRTYWYGERWSTPQIRRAQTGAAWFGTWPGQLGASRRLGADITVTVAGDVDSWPLISLTGPADDVTITGPGLYVSIPDGLGDNEPALIDTDPRTLRALFSGVSDWARIAPSTMRAPFAPGDNVIDIDISGVGDNTVAVVSGPSLWETPW